MKAGDWLAIRFGVPDALKIEIASEAEYEVGVLLACLFLSTRGCFASLVCLCRPMPFSEYIVCN